MYMHVCDSRIGLLGLWKLRSPSIRGQEARDAGEPMVYVLVQGQEKTLVPAPAGRRNSFFPCLFVLFWL